MSRKDDRKRKKRDLKKKKARKVEEARRLQRKRDAQNAKVNVEMILERLKVLFNEDASRAISYALNDSLSDEDIARQLEVPLDRVSELLDLAAQLPGPIVEHFRRFPQVMANPAVLEAIVQGVRQGGHRF